MENKENIKIKMRPHLNKMLAHFNYLMFSETDGELDNIVLSKGDKNIKIAYHAFYGYSRIGRKDIDEGERFLKSIEITNEMYVNDYLKPWIEALLFAHGMFSN